MQGMYHVLFILIVLHGVDGREVDVSVDEITSLQCRVPNAKNQLMTEGVNAVINLTDGRFVSVVETCMTIREMIEEKEK